MLKETEETIVFFVTFLSLVGFQWGAGPLATPMDKLISYVNSNFRFQNFQK